MSSACTPGCHLKGLIVHEHLADDGKSYDIKPNIARHGTVTRFEVIDHRKDGEGRVFVAYDIQVELMYQDNNRTLKVRITDRE
jgi:hypothetical protein